jgi:poly(A) polymerase
MAEAVLARLHAPAELRDVVAEVCREHIHFAALPAMRPARRERWLRSARFPIHLAFHRADCLGSHGKLELYDFAARAHAELPPLAEVLVTGRDVLELGLPAGPAVGKLLAAVHAAADEASVPWDRERALQLLRELVARERQGRSDPAR